MTITFNDPTVLLWALGAILIGYFGARFLAGLSPARSADDKQANAWMAILLGLAGCVGLFVTFILLFIGGAGWAFLATLGLFSAAFGIGSRS